MPYTSFYNQYKRYIICQSAVCSLHMSHTAPVLSFNDHHIHKTKQQKHLYNQHLVSGQLQKNTTLLWTPIWSRDTGQWISSYDSCHLNITCRSYIKDICCNPRLRDLVLVGWPPCCATSFVVVVGRTRP